MLTTVQAGPFTIRGVSVGGVYTSLHVPELDALFDVGIAPRSFAAADTLFLSHAHADHVGAMTALLGLRGLIRRPSLRLFLPAEITETLTDAMRTMGKLQRYDFEIDPVPMSPGDEHQLRGDLSVRAFRTFHPVPSLGYEIVRRVNKLRREFLGLDGREIAERRRRGENLFHADERPELAYATDTLVSVLDQHPHLYRTRVLILECSFLDDRKDLQSSRAGCHIHLDELLERADLFQNERLVLMHFSQIYRPDEIPHILKQRCPPRLFERIVPFAPVRKHWPG